MADFKKAFEKLDLAEGGYADDKDDRGYVSLYDALKAKFGGLSV